MQSIKFTEKIIVNRNQVSVFDFSQDYQKRLTWDTFLKRAELINGADSAGIGIKAYCVAHNGMGMETEYVSFNRPKVTAIKMTKGPYMFKSFLGSWTFRELAQEQTEVIFLYAFELRFPFNIFNPLIRKNLQTNVKQRLADLKSCLENTNPEEVQHH
jgi:ribosome-associated toxin RatA of RatAB toxin-antitoxin module